MPPPAAPGAPATYVFGVQLTSAQQALVRRGLDAGARLYRSTLGRELPPFTVWAYTNLEELIGAYAANRPTTPEDARRLWEGGQVAHATPRQAWFGPSWFESRPPEATLKIAAHEAFHLLHRNREPKLTFAYHEAIARGVSWSEAFATTFGRTFEAFVAEFEAYRRTA